VSVSFRLTALEVATTVAAVGLGGFLTRIYFDARDTWWKRAEWAMDKGTSADDLEQKVGLATMSKLLDSRLATGKDAELLGTAMRAIADDALEHAFEELERQADLQDRALDTAAGLPHHGQDDQDRDDEPVADDEPVVGDEPAAADEPVEDEQEGRR